MSSLDEAARRFFALPEAEKAEIAMARAGAAWRGWFPLGGELTSGRPDGKEGLYFGEELDVTDAECGPAGPCTDRTSSRKACQTFGAPCWRGWTR